MLGLASGGVGFVLHHAVLLLMVAVTGLGLHDTPHPSVWLVPAAALTLWAVLTTRASTKRVAWASLPWFAYILFPVVIGLGLDDPDAWFIGGAGIVAHLLAYVVARRRAR